MKTEEVSKPLDNALKYNLDLYVDLKAKNDELSPTEEKDKILSFLFVTQMSICLVRIKQLQQLRGAILKKVQELPAEVEEALKNVKEVATLSAEGLTFTSVDGKDISLADLKATLALKHDGGKN